MMTRSLAILAFALGSTAALAAPEIPYDYVDLELLSVDAGAGSESGLSVGGSMSFSDMFYGVAALSDVDTTTSLGVGAGLHGSISPNLHVFGELLIISVDAGGPAGSDTGFQLGGGLRGMASPALELFGRVDHVDVFNGSDEALTVGGIYYFSRIGVSAAFTSNDTADAVAVGVRFTF